MRPGTVLVVGAGLAGARARRPSAWRATTAG